jgi:hypothetical protein
MAYLLDTNVFVNAKRDWYGFDFCPAFWDWLDQAYAAGVVASVEAVYDELVEYSDELSEWARARKPFFRSVAPDEVAAVAAVNRWANDSPAFDPAAKVAFSSAADSFLIAQALSGGHVVVTHEVIKDTRKSIQIPNAAAALGVPCQLPWHMLRVERPRFVLEGVA